MAGIITMDILTFIRYYTEFGYCYRVDKTNFLLDELAHFLSTEVQCFGTLRLTRLINQLVEDGDSTSGNLIDIEKKGKNLYLRYVYEDTKDLSEALEISKEELFKLMPIWEKLMKKKPEEIFLIRDNSKFELIGKSASKEIINEDAEC
jgi:hypothetical protein